MAQYVRRYALLDPNRFGSITHNPVELACGDGQEGIAAGKQPQPWLRHPPVVLEDRQQLWREHRMPVLLALPLFDADQHALAVDVRHLEVGNFGDTQTGAVGHAEGGLVFDTGCRTMVRCRHISGRLSVTRKKNRSAATELLMVGGCVPSLIWCT